MEVWFEVSPGPLQDGFKSPNQSAGLPYTSTPALTHSHASHGHRSTNTINTHTHTYTHRHTNTERQRQHKEKYRDRTQIQTPKTNERTNKHANTPKQPYTLTDIANRNPSAINYTLMTLAAGSNIALAYNSTTRTMLNCMPKRSDMHPDAVVRPHAPELW